MTGRAHAACRPQMRQNAFLTPACLSFAMDRTVTVIVDINEAKTQFSRLLARVQSGKEAIVAEAGTHVARLVPMQTTANDRQPGSARGMIDIGAEFDAPLSTDISGEFNA